jgi:hypothetical protein
MHEPAIAPQILQKSPSAYPLSPGYRHAMLPPSHPDQSLPGEEVRGEEEATTGRTPTHIMKPGTAGMVPACGPEESVQLSPRPDPTDVL